MSKGNVNDMSAPLTINFRLEGLCADIVRKLANVYSNGDHNEYARKQFKALLLADLDVSEILNAADIKPELVQQLKERLADEVMP